MVRLKFEIEELCKHPANSRKLICRNTIEYNENVIFPYEKVMEVFRCLYPSKDLVFNFTII